MFPYRRQGSKKRNKNGPGRNKPRGPQKGLPNSARELLPFLQPATKALAQMLAGRSNPSGQLGHAQAVLAQAERLVAERAHNRLNPAEREEYFEQLARLKLTVADAAAEAEVLAAEEQAPKMPAPPVDQERLRQMALALASPEPETALAEPDSDDASAAVLEADAFAADDGSSEPEPPGASEGDAGRQSEGAPARTSAVNARAGRLQLSGRISEDAAFPAQGRESDPAGDARRRVVRRKLKPVAPSGHAAPGQAVGQEQASVGQESAVPEQAAQEDAPPADHPARPADEANGEDSPGAADADADVQAGAEAGRRAARSPARRARRSKNQGLPEGWVIDEEGYVVPGPG